jgi:hypothetical protein
VFRTQQCRVLNRFLYQTYLLNYFLLCPARGWNQLLDSCILYGSFAGVPERRLCTQLDGEWLFRMDCIKRKLKYQVLYWYIIILIEWMAGQFEIPIL